MPRLIELVQPHMLPEMMYKLGHLPTASTPSRNATPFPNHPFDEPLSHFLTYLSPSLDAYTLLLTISGLTEWARISNLLLPNEHLVAAGWVASLAKGAIGPDGRAVSGLPKILERRS